MELKSDILYQLLKFIPVKKQYDILLKSKLLYKIWETCKLNQLINIKYEDYDVSNKYLNFKFKINNVPYNIKDVSMLGNVHTLNLWGCKNIKDVSMLGNLHTLNLSYTNIKDVSMLGKVNIIK